MLVQRIVLLSHCQALFLATRRSVLRISITGVVVSTSVVVFVIIGSIGVGVYQCGYEKIDNNITKQK
jgi:hypothetical protein